MIDITNIPHRVKELTEKAGKWTMQIEKLLQSNTAIDIAAVIPDGEVDREAVISICETAIKGCQALAAIADSAGVKARLQRLMSDIVSIQHSEEKHTISWYITRCEIVFNDIFGKL